MWMGGIWGDGIVSSNGTLAVESNLVVGGTNVVSLAGQIATNVVGAATNALLDLSLIHIYLRTRTVPDW